MATIKAADKLSNTNYYVVLSLVTLLVVGASGIAVKSLFGTVARDTKVVNAKNKANSQLDKNITAAPDLVNSYKGLGARQPLLANALPRTDDYPSLIALLENVASASGVVFKSVDRSLVASVATVQATTTKTTVAKQTGPQKLDFTVSIQGTYANLNKYLGNLEASARPMHVNSMQISGTSSDLNISLSITTYYQATATLPITMETIK